MNLNRVLLIYNNIVSGFNIFLSVRISEELCFNVLHDSRDGILQLTLFLDYELEGGNHDIPNQTLKSEQYFL